MSWAKHDPEGWDKVCRNGIVQKIEDAIQADSGEPIDHQTLDDAVHAIWQDPKGDKVFDALMTWANKEIGEAEADHFSGMIDDAMERARGPT